jgi:hypothetical protein
MRRAFEIDVLLCPHCGGRRRIVALYPAGPRLRDLLALCLAKMVMGLRPTLHHENRLSSPLRRRPDTSIVFGIASPSKN